MTHKYQTSFRFPPVICHQLRKLCDTNASSGDRTGDRCTDYALSPFLCIRSRPNIVHARTLPGLSRVASALTLAPPLVWRYMQGCCDRYAVGCVIQLSKIAYQGIDLLFGSKNRVNDPQALLRQSVAGIYLCE